MTLKTESPTEVALDPATEQPESTPPKVGYHTSPRETPAKEVEVTWPEFLKKASDDAIKERLSTELSDVLKTYGLENDCCLALFEPEDSIDL